MEFSLSTEQEILRDSVRSFAEKEIKPVAQDLDKHEAFSYDTMQKMAELGLFGIFVSEKYGGQGMDYISYIIATEEIARIAILRYKAQCLFGTHTTDQDGRVRFAEGLGVVDRVGQLNMLPFERGGVPRPHMFGDLEDLFQFLETFLGRWERHPQTRCLVLVPGGANSEVGPPARKRIQRGDHFYHYSRMTVDRPSDKQADLDLFCDPGKETQCCVAFDHLRFRLT